MSVIGYKGSPEERFAYWRSMVDVRAIVNAFKGQEDYKTIVEMNEECYKNYMKEYLE